MRTYDPGMTYRGVYRDGVVVLQGEVALQDGESVEVNSAPPAKTKTRREGKAGVKSKATAPARTGKKTRSAAKCATRALPGAGMWKDRWPKSMSSADVARTLRDEVSRRKR